MVCLGWSADSPADIHGKRHTITGLVFSLPQGALLSDYNEPHERVVPCGFSVPTNGSWILQFECSGSLSITDLG